MTLTGGAIQDDSLGELVTRLSESGKAYAKAEVELAKQTVLARVAALKPAVILVVIAILLVQAALTVLTGALGMLLATWIGAAGGLAAGAAIVLLLAGILVWAAVSKLKGKPA